MLDKIPMTQGDLYLEGQRGVGPETNHSPEGLESFIGYGFWRGGQQTSKNPRQQQRRARHGSRWAFEFRDGDEGGECGLGKLDRGANCRFWPTPIGLRGRYRHGPSSPVASAHGEAIGNRLPALRQREAQFRVRDGLSLSQHDSRRTRGRKASCPAHRDQGTNRVFLRLAVHITASVAVLPAGLFAVSCPATVRRNGAVGRS
jgi:hypothetical protein